jgi:hypothetical protein
MNQIFRFKSFAWSGWATILLVPLVFLYFKYAGWLFDLLHIPLDQINNQVIWGIVFFLPLYGLFALINYPIQALLKSKSYLEIKDGFLNLVMLSKVQWSVQIASITAMDDSQGHHSVKADFVKTMLSKGRGSPMIGFSLTAQNETYQVKNFLENFEGFKQVITGLNPKIQFATVTQAADTDLYNEDIGKMIQDKANGLPVISGFGKFVSKLNLVSGLILGLIITFALIIWLVLATS